MFGAYSSHIFADELNVLISPPICRGVKPMIKFLEEEGTKICNKIAIYSKKWKQPVNLSKTVVQVFHSQVQNPVVDIYMEGKKLEVVKEFKYLGLTWINKMSLKPTIDKTLENIQRTFSKLRWMKGGKILSTEINGAAVKNQTFAECTYLVGMTGDINDGILGLAFPSLTKDGEKSFFYNMWSQGLIPQAIFSFYLNPDTNATSGGELIFGGADPSKYTGSITYISVSIEGYWEFPMTSVSVGSTSISSSTYAIADRGTALIVGPTAQVESLSGALDGTYDSNSQLYTVDCHTRSLSSFPNVTFTIGDTVFILTPLQYLWITGDQSTGCICYSVFSPSDSSDSNGNLFWILGDYFLYRYYSVFDILNNRVDFATSISYDWMPTVDSSLFPTSSTTTEISSIPNRGNSTVHRPAMHFSLFALIVMVATRYMNSF
ncbi:unnamed protein product [Rotaria magnacalcarata]|uniref:Peptidase A1 domain-containing protein n=1 Tax=Rotaria magnacalcarata TaxID=392030 RepID=A0A816NC93_9BILA|nr:unnamed protein product [Rotaria magnacalcarata]